MIVAALLPVMSHAHEGHAGHGPDCVHTDASNDMSDDMHADAATTHCDAAGHGIAQHGASHDPDSSELGCCSSFACAVHCLSAVALHSSSWKLLTQVADKSLFAYEATMLSRVGYVELQPPR